MRIDVKGFVQWGCVSDIVQWGCVSDIPLAVMDCVEYPDYYLKGDLSFYVMVLQYHFPLQFDCEHRYFQYWLCEFHSVHNRCLCGSPTLPVTCIWLFCIGEAFFIFMLFVGLLCEL
jgi:hypothetical protein